MSDSRRSVILVLVIGVAIGGLSWGWRTWFTGSPSRASHPDFYDHNAVLAQRDDHSIFLWITAEGFHSSVLRGHDDFQLFPSIMYEGDALSLLTHRDAIIAYLAEGRTSSSKAAEVAKRLVMANDFATSSNPRYANYPPPMSASEIMFLHGIDFNNARQHDYNLALHKAHAYISSHLIGRDLNVLHDILTGAGWQITREDLSIITGIEE